jgi:hypothetical protein
MNMCGCLFCVLAIYADNTIYIPFLSAKMMYALQLCGGSPSQSIKFEYAKMKNKIKKTKTKNAVAQSMYPAELRYVLEKKEWLGSSRECRDYKE